MTRLRIAFLSLIPLALVALLFGVVAVSAATPTEVRDLLVQNVAERGNVTCQDRFAFWECFTPTNTTLVTFTHPGGGEKLDYWAGFNPPSNAAACTSTINGQTRSVVCTNAGATFGADRVSYYPGIPTATATPTSTGTPMPSATATSTPTPTSTGTSVPSSTGQPTNTAIPTSTSVVVNTPTAIPTNTPPTTAQPTPSQGASTRVYLSVTVLDRSTPTPTPVPMTEAERSVRDLLIKSDTNRQKAKCLKLEGIAWRCTSTEPIVWTHSGGYNSIDYAVRDPAPTVTGAHDCQVTTPADFRRITCNQPGATVVTDGLTLWRG